MRVYKCYKCGKIVLRERPLEGSSLMCSCGSRILMKVRPQQIKRVKAI
jgi:DNA-directed RNA polymerase subunit RPC12/RpoP